MTHDPTEAFTRTVWAWATADVPHRMLWTPQTAYIQLENQREIVTLYTVEPDSTRVVLPRVLSRDARNAAMNGFESNRMSMQAAFDAIIEHYRKGGN